MCVILKEQHVSHATKTLKSIQLQNKQYATVKNFDLSLQKELLLSVVSTIL